MNAWKELDQSHALGLALPFLAGVVACMGLWFGLSGDTENVEIRRVQSGATSSASAPQTGASTAKGRSSSLPLEPSMAATRPSENTSPSALNDEVRQLLIETLEAPEEERLARLGILLGRLRRGGLASAQWIRDYLASASEVSREALYGAKQGKMLGNLPPLRELLGQTLIEIAEANPSVGKEVASVGLDSARTMQEAMDFIQLGEKVAPGAMRDSAIATVERMFEGELETFDLARGASVMARFQAEELLPDLESALKKKPYDVSDYLTALWHLPDEKRIEATRYALGMERVREAMQVNPHMCTQLDMREPEFRAAVVADFAVPKSEEQRMYLIRELGMYDRVLTSLDNMLPSSGEKPAPAPGQPGSKEQALARLMLLDELESYCTTPLLQQHLVDSRERLTKFVNTP